MPTVNIFGMLSQRRNAAIPKLCEAAMPPCSKRQQEDSWPLQAGPCPSGYPFAIRVQVPPIDEVELALKLHQLRLRLWCAHKGRRLPPPPLDESLKLVFDEWFQMLDAGKAGQLGRDQVAQSLTQSGAAPYQEQAVAEMLQLLDMDSDGKVDWAEFRHFLNSEVASGKDVLNSEFVLPSGRTLPLAPVLAVLRRKKMMCDIISNKDGQARADWAAKSGEVLEAITSKREDLEKAMRQQQIQRLRDLKKTITMRSRRESASFADMALAASRRYDSQRSHSSGRASSARNSPVQSPRGERGSSTNSPRPAWRVTATSESGALSPRLAVTSYNNELRASNAQLSDAALQTGPYEGYKNLTPYAEDSEHTGPPEFEVLLQHVDKMLLAYELRMMGKRVPMPEPVLAKPGACAASARSMSGGTATGIGAVTGTGAAMDIGAARAGGMTPGQAMAARGSHGQLLQPNITHSAQWANSLRPGESMVEARARPAGVVVRADVMEPVDSGQPTVLEYRKPQRTESRGRSVKPSIRESMGLQPRHSEPANRPHSATAAEGSTPAVLGSTAPHTAAFGVRQSGAGGPSTPTGTATSPVPKVQIGASTQDTRESVHQVTGSSLLGQDWRRSSSGVKPRVSLTGGVQSRMRPMSAAPAGVPRLSLHTMPASTREAEPLSPAQESLVSIARDSCRESLAHLGFEPDTASTMFMRPGSAYTVRPRPRSALATTQHTRRCSPRPGAACTPAQISQDAQTQQPQQAVYQGAREDIPASITRSTQGGHAPAGHPPTGSVGSWGQQEPGMTSTMHDVSVSMMVASPRTQSKPRPWSCLPKHKSDIRSFLASCGPREEAVPLRAITEGHQQTCRPMTADASVASRPMTADPSVASRPMSACPSVASYGASHMSAFTAKQHAQCRPSMQEQHVQHRSCMQEHVEESADDSMCGDDQDGLQGVAATAGKDESEAQPGLDVSSMSSCQDALAEEALHEQKDHAACAMQVYKHEGVLSVPAQTEQGVGMQSHVVNVQTPRQQAAAAAIARMMARTKPTDWQLSQAHAARLL